MKALISNNIEELTPQATSPKDQNENGLVKDSDPKSKTTSAKSVHDNVDPSVFEIQNFGDDETVDVTLEDMFVKINANWNLNTKGKKKKSNDRGKSKAEKPAKSETAPPKTKKKSLNNLNKITLKLAGDEGAIVIPVKDNKAAKKKPPKPKAKPKPVKKRETKLEKKTKAEATPRKPAPPTETRKLYKKFKVERTKR